MSRPFTASQVIRELERDINYNQPEDILQFCANWCNSKLAEERLEDHADWSTAHPHLAGADYTFGRAEEDRTSQRRGSITTASANDAAIGGIWNSNLHQNNTAAWNTADAPLSSSDTQPSLNIAALGIPLAYNLARRTSVSAESLDPSKFAEMRQVERTTKDASQVERIERAINDNFLFRNLDPEQHDDVLGVMKEVQVANGTDVITQGAIGDYFYVVERGTFDVWVTPPPVHNYDSATRITTTVDSTEGRKRVAQIEAGGSFGELALMYNAPRAATVTATSDAVLWAIDRITFRSILMSHTVRKRRMYEDLLREVPILHTLQPHERAKIADSLESRVFEPNQDVVREGEVGQDFYIIEQGEAEVLRWDHGHSEERQVNVLKKGDYFGEIALMNNSKRQATVRATTRLCVASLGEKAFTRLLGPIKDILKRNAGAYITLPTTAYNAASTSPPPSKSRKSDSPSSSRDY